MAHFIHLKWIGYITEITDILRKAIDNNLYTCDVFFFSFLAWGSAYKTHIRKIPVKQNHIFRLFVFFCPTYGEETERAKPSLNLLRILKVYKVYRLHVLKFTYSWHKGMLPEVFQYEIYEMFQYASNIRGYGTRYAAKQIFYKFGVRTNVGKQSVSFIAIDIWKDLSSSIKDSSTFEISQTLYLLCEKKLYKIVH